jgi:hypothetical protein
MIKSIKINPTKVNHVLDNQITPNIQSEIPSIPTDNATSSSQSFRSIFDTFVTSEPLGFGLYDKKFI